MDSQDYVAPECKFDFPAMLRDGILSDVRCFGHAERCHLQMSSVFADFNQEQIERWCDDNNLAIIAKPAGQIIICPATANALRLHGITAPDIADHEARIRAEVEAMDWPEVIGE